MGRKNKSLFRKNGYVNSFDLIRKELLNEEVEMARVGSIVDKETAAVDCYNNLPDCDRSKASDRKRATLAQARLRAYKPYLEKLAVDYQSTMDAIDGILKKYESRYSEVFYMAFIDRGNRISDIADKTGYTQAAIYHILESLSGELVLLKKSKER